MSDKSRRISSAASEIEAYEESLKFIFNPEYGFLEMVAENRIGAKNIIGKVLEKVVEIGGVKSLSFSFNNCSMPDEELNKILKLLSKSRIRKMEIVLSKRKKDDSVLGRGSVGFEFSLESLKPEELESWLRDVGNGNFHAEEAILCLRKLSYVCIALDSGAYDDVKRLLTKIVNRIPTPIPSLEEFVLYAPSCGLKNDDFVLFLKPISDFKLGKSPLNKNEFRNLRASDNVSPHFELRKLDIEIQENKIEDLNPLGDALSKLTELRNLYLDASHNEIDYIEKLTEGLKALKNLEKLWLDLSYNPIGGYPILMLVRALKSLNNLKDVHLVLDETWSDDYFENIYVEVVDLKEKIPKLSAILDHESGFFEIC